MTPTTEQKLISDMSEVKTTLNGIIENFGQHVKDGVAWRTAILGIVVMLIAQFVTFAYMYGKMSEAVKYNSRAVVSMYSFCDRVKEHISIDEARWDIFDLKEKVGDKNG